MSKYDMNDLYEMKKEILARKANTPKDDKETLKNINLEYMRIQKKIQYYRDDEYRLNKIKAATEYNKSNVDKLNEYHRLYYHNKKHYISCV